MSLELQAKVTWDVTYVAQWAAASSNYSVEYYKENLDGGFDNIKTLNLSWTTRNHVEAVKEEIWMIYPWWKQSTLSWDIKWDWSLVLKLYYTRDSYELTYVTSLLIPGQSEVKENVKYEENKSSRNFSYLIYIKLME